MLYYNILHDYTSILPMKAGCLNRQQLFDVCAASEDPLQVHPAPLYINPHIEQTVDAVQLVLPRQCIFLKLLQGDIYCIGLPYFFRSLQFKNKKGIKFVYFSLFLHDISSIL